MLHSFEKLVCECQCYVATTRRSKEANATVIVVQNTESDNVGLEMVRADVKQLVC